MVPRGARGILTASILLPILAIITVALRVLARKKKSVALQSDDWTIIVNLVVAVSIDIGTIYACCTGLHGISYALMSPESYTRYRKYQFAHILLTHFVYGMTKISVILFYKRVFITPRFRFWTNASLVVVSMWMISAFLSLLLCSHGVSSFWSTPAMIDSIEYRLNLSDLLIAMNSIDIVFDTWILCLPIPVIKGLHMTSRRKIGVACVFLLGAFCLISSAVRLYYSHALLTYYGIDFAKRTRISDDNLMWAGIECCASTIAACLPTLAPLFPSVRSPESLISSAKSALSVISIKSNSLFSLNKRKPAFSNESLSNSDGTKRAWYELHSPDTRTSAPRESGSRDLEAQG